MMQSHRADPIDLIQHMEHLSMPEATSSVLETKQVDQEELPELLDLEGLVDAIEGELAVHGGFPKDKMKMVKIMERFTGDESEFEEYVHFDDDSKYTRNLVATDGRTYALLVLCWTKGKGSPIHNHPGDGCWMSVLKGKIRETHYDAGKSDASGEAPLRKTKENLYEDSSSSPERRGVKCAYIDDTIALHKVENPSSDKGAISLHLYSPPPAKVSVWQNENRADLRTEGRCDVFYSKYGEKC